MSDQDPSSDVNVFRILIVCTANICRSPTAEYLLRNELLRLAPPVTFEVSSAGVRGWGGSEMDPMAAAELRRLGGDPADFRARSFTAAMGGAADLLLTATTDHRSYVLQEVPRALRRTFTLLEFAYLAAAAEDVRDARGDAPEVVKEAAANRGAVRIDAYDLPDPYGRSEDAYRETAQSICAAVSVIADIFATPISAPR
jgi:low molecular weight protein-tyrosine phosphatase